MSEGKLLRVTGLWVNTQRDGNQYLNGSLGGLRLFVFKNSYKKEGSNEPDYNLFVTANETKKTDKPKEESAKDDTPVDTGDLPF